MHLIHALAECRTCGKVWDSKNAMGVAARNNQATGHEVAVEVCYSHRSLSCSAEIMIPDGLDACHRCDNRGCGNIDHLFLGTPKENIHDMIRKGRHNFRHLKHSGPSAQESAQGKLSPPVTD